MYIEDTDHPHLIILVNVSYFLVETIEFLLIMNIRFLSMKFFFSFFFFLARENRSGKSYFNCGSSVINVSFPLALTGVDVSRSSSSDHIVYLYFYGETVLFGIFSDDRTQFELSVI